MNTKYELTDRTIIVDNHILHRIRALKDFGNVKKGDFGGYIETEDNLSQNGRSWIFNNAKVFGNARICENAMVFNNVKVFEDANAYEDARIYGHVIMWGSAQIGGSARVCDNAKIYENAYIYGKSLVYGNSCVCGNSHIYGHSHVYDNTALSGEVWIRDACICGNAILDGCFEVRNIKISSGIWNKEVKIDNKWYLISTTLEKISSS